MGTIGRQRDTMEKALPQCEPVVVATDRHNPMRFSTQCKFLAQLYSTAMFRRRSITVSGMDIAQDLGEFVGRGGMSVF